jgi:tripartite-type tricarboxylate transporter receptor subunit TctC
VIVENRPGAGGMPGTEAAAKSAPDGYTLLAGNPGPLTIAPAARAQVPYDALRDLAPIILIAKSASCLCAHPSLPVKGIKDFVPFAKARPGRVNYGTPGVGDEYAQFLKAEIEKWAQVGKKAGIPRQ